MRARLSPVRPHVIVLSGAVGCGKTTVCEKVAARARQEGLRVGGVLTLHRSDPELGAVREVVDLATGTGRMLAATTGLCDGPRIGHWGFRRDAIEWGNERLEASCPCDLLIIDEIGPLELVRDEGWNRAIPVLNARQFGLALVVVRPVLEQQFRVRVSHLQVELLSLTVSNRDTMPDEIMARVKGAA